jgi:hypothetical protein
MKPAIIQLFYTVKPLIPRLAQISLRRLVALQKRAKCAHIWPIDANAAKPPEGWAGWPDGKQFALVLSHDVDTLKGYNNVLKLADIEEAMGFRSSFNFVPERYGEISLDLLRELKQRGFGIGVHGLKHDGKLFSSKKIFDERAPQINAYLKKWGTRGFTTPSMIRNHDWMHALDMDYCVSTFDTDPFEPQSDGVGTIFPYWVPNVSANQGFMELPYTLPQDSTLFVILQEKTIDIWTQKLDWVAERGGMVLLNTHPDYMDFRSGGDDFTYPVGHYIDFLTHLKTCYAEMYYHALTAEVARVSFEALFPVWDSPHRYVLPTPRYAAASAFVRKYPRVPVSIHALCDALDLEGNPHDKHMAVIKEVSRGGLAIELPISPISEQVSLSFMNAENRDVYIRAKVVHSRKNSHKTRIGLSLTGLPMEIDRFVAQVMQTHCSGAEL